MRCLPVAALAIVAIMASPGQAVLELAGSAYRGPITVAAVGPKDGTLHHSGSGQAEITLSRNQKGQVLLQGQATIEGQQAMRFDHTLSEQADGSWLQEGDDTRVESSLAGEFSILARSNGSTITAVDEIDASTFQMHLSTSGHPVEPDFVFAFNLVSHDHARPDKRGKCDQVIWQPRAIANPFSGSMSSVMVPVCIPTPRAPQPKNSVPNKIAPLLYVSRTNEDA